MGGPPEACADALRGARRDADLLGRASAYGRLVAGSFACGRALLAAGAARGAEAIFQEARRGAGKATRLYGRAHFEMCIYPGALARIHP